MENEQKCRTPVTFKRIRISESAFIVDFSQKPYPKQLNCVYLFDIQKTLPKTSEFISVENSFTTFKCVVEKCLKPHSPLQPYLN